MIDLRREELEKIYFSDLKSFERLNAYIAWAHRWANVCNHRVVPCSGIHEEGERVLICNTELSHWSKPEHRVTREQIGDCVSTWAKNCSQQLDGLAVLTDCLCVLLGVEPEKRWCGHMDGTLRIHLLKKEMTEPTFVVEPKDLTVCPICSAPRPKD